MSDLCPQEPDEAPAEYQAEEAPWHSGPSPAPSPSPVGQYDSSSTPAPTPSYPYPEPVTAETYFRDSTPTVQQYSYPTSEPYDASSYATGLSGVGAWDEGVEVRRPWWRRWGWGRGREELGREERRARAQEAVRRQQRAAGSVAGVREALGLVWKVRSWDERAGLGW